MAEPIPVTINISDQEIADALRAPRPEFLLTPQQVAGILNVDRQTVYRYVKDGKLSAVRPLGRGPGRLIRIPVTQVADMLSRHGDESVR